MRRNIWMGLALAGALVLGCDDEAATADPVADSAVAGGTGGAGGSGGEGGEGGQVVDAALVDADLVVDLGPPEPLPAPPDPVAFIEGRFASGMTCALCHSNSPNATAMRDADDNELGPFNLWQASSMANAARDPIWKAAVSVEVAATPDAKEEIESTCIRCHAPMGWYLSLPEDRTLEMFEGNTANSVLGREGVACTVCHAIEPDNLGTEASFTGGFDIRVNTKIYGPHRDPATRPMQVHTGLTPTYSEHVLDSGLCGTCHTVITPSLTADAQPTGHDFVEQGTYLEWRNSSHAERDATCQRCHMPTVDDNGVPIRTRIARSPPGGDFFIDEREPFGRHLFLGGNTLLPQILRDNAEHLKPVATRRAFDAHIANSKAFLATAASLEFGSARTRDDGRVELPVQVFNQAGHKLPTAYPSRRMWLRMVARDDNGTVLFDSGAFDENGLIVNSGGVALPFEHRGGPWPAHQQVIESANQVQIYGSVMCDAEGQPTWRLMRAATYCKDNRILPDGWRPDHADGERTLPVGVEGDDDFVAGADTTHYVLPAGTASVEAVLLYQPLTNRYVEEMYRYDTPEVRALKYYLDRADRRPEVILRASLEL